MTRPPYISLPQAARRLGVSLNRAIEMIHDQHLRAKLSSGRWWIETVALDALLRERKRGREAGGRAA